MENRRKPAPTAATLDINWRLRKNMSSIISSALSLTRQMRVFTDDTGTQRSEPMTDETGNPVYNPGSRSRPRADDRASLRIAADHVGARRHPGAFRA